MALPVGNAKSSAKPTGVSKFACLQKMAKGASFFQDERIELNRENRDRKRRGMKILPPSQPLTSEADQSDVK